MTDFFLFFFLCQGYQKMVKGKKIREEQKKGGVERENKLNLMSEKGEKKRNIEKEKGNRNGKARQKFFLFPKS